MVVLLFLNLPLFQFFAKKKPQMKLSPLFTLIYIHTYRLCPEEGSTILIYIYKPSLPRRRLCLRNRPAARAKRIRRTITELRCFYPQRGPKEERGTTRQTVL